MKRVLSLVFAATFIFVVGSLNVYAAKKLLVQPFVQINIPESDGIGTKVSKKMEAVFFDNGGYDPVSIEDVVAGAALGESKQAFGSSDDKYMKSLLNTSRIDLIVYGTIKSSDGYIFITGKLLDKSRGAVELSRIRTVRIKDKFRTSSFFEEGCSILAKYLITGKDSDVQKFQDKMYAIERRSEVDSRNAEIGRQDQKADDDFSSSVREFKERRRSEIAGKYVFWRIGYGQWGLKSKNSEFNDYYDSGRQFMTDFIIPFDRESLSGLDFYFRYTYRSFRRHSDLDYSTTGPLYTSYISKGTYYTQNLWDIGLRYRFGFYFLMTKFDLYLLAAGRMSVEGGYGYYWGAGTEVAFFQHLGVFAEYNYGMLKEGSENVDFENSQFIFGATFRL